MVAREKESTAHKRMGEACFSFSHREKVPEVRMRELRPRSEGVVRSEKELLSRSEGVVRSERGFPHPALRVTYARWEKEAIARAWMGEISFSFSHREKVPEGRMRELRPRSEEIVRSEKELLSRSEGIVRSERGFPHPALRATFSRWKKGAEATGCA